MGNNLRRMCLSIPAPPPPNAAKALAVLGNPRRWLMVQMLASGRALTASQMAAALGHDFDGVSKHMRVLRAAGLLASRHGADRRLELYYIPEVFRPRPGILDYGFCMFRIAEAPK